MRYKFAFRKEFLGGDLSPVLFCRFCTLEMAEETAQATGTVYVESWQLDRQ